MRLYAEIEVRLRQLLERLEDGDDAPPGPRLRLEGLCEAAVLSGECDAPAIDELLDSLHRELRGRSLDEALGAGWREAHPFPELPLFMDRAPVSPSTGP
jgi:hypothetical protein